MEVTQTFYFNFTIVIDQYCHDMSSILKKGQIRVRIKIQMLKAVEVVA